MSKFTNIIELICKYPLKNSAWTVTDADKAVIYADASDLGLRPGVSPFAAGKNGHLLDPWKRKFPHPPMRQSNEDGDIQFWVFETTVAGFPVRCKIFND